MITMTHERHILGTAIDTNGACLSDLVAIGIEAHHFTEPAHRALWEILNDRYDKGEPVEARFLEQAIQQTENPRKYGPASLPSDLARWKTHHIEHEARELMGHFTIKQIREHGHRCAKAASGGIPEGRAYDYAKGLLEKVEVDVGGMDVAPCSQEETGEDMARSLMDDLEASRNPQTAAKPISTGIDTLDGLFRAEDDHTTVTGLVDTEFGVVAGRPGMGKTALAENMSLSIARAGHGVAIASCDMTNTQLRGRLLAKIAREIAGPGRSSPPVGQLMSRAVMSGLSEHHYALAVEATMELDALPLNITNIQRPSIREIRSYARRVANRLRREGTPLKFLVVDYLDKIKGDTREGDRRLQIGVIVNQLKALAAELDCTVCLLVQINRAADLNPGGKPATRNLKESGDIEQAADWIWLAWREHEYDRNRPKEEMVVIQAKNRRGKPGREVTLSWHGPTGTIADTPYRATHTPNNIRKLPSRRERADASEGWTD